MVISSRIDHESNSGSAVSLSRDQVMTAGEVAEFLQVPVSTVYCLANRGELPATPNPDADPSS